MKIKEVENQTGITSHNIRFYEKEQLIFPQRNPMNGYREYTDADVKLLNRIKLLRILDISVSEIRECIQGRKNLSDVYYNAGTANRRFSGYGGRRYDKSKARTVSGGRPGLFFR